MGMLIRKYDWSTSEIGTPNHWPVSLRTTISIIIHSKFPMFLWWGPNLLCFYNDAYRPSLGSEGKHPFILGMPAEEAWPEIWDFVKPLIDQVMAGEGSVYHEDLLVPIFRNGKLEDVFWTFSYSPVPDDEGGIGGVLVTCHETTQNVKLLQHLRESERRFQQLINDTSLGVIVLNGPQLEVAIVNNAYGNLIGRTVQELVGRPLFDILPHAEAEYRPIMESVIESGETKVLSGHPYLVYQTNRTITGYLNIIYQPYREKAAAITGVMVICQDVSELVRSKRLMETALEQVRLSKEAAQLGLFDMDLDKGTMEWDPRCRELFGIFHDDEVSYEKDFVSGLHHEDRERITTLISELFDNPALNGDYDVEYRTVGVADGQIRWVRAKGKVYFDRLSHPVRFIGSVLDITPQKLNEQRKNDFIAIVSHELKTPLTSLTGYIQLLLREFDRGTGSFESDILNRSNVQAKKMTTIINGFLNVSRLELGKLELVRTTFQLDHLIRGIIADLTVELTNADFHFIPCSPIEVHIDKEKIGAVITNLLTNAVKYSAREKRVTISCRVDADMVVVSVADKGLGIKPEHLQHVFDRFYRVEHESAKDISGFGIGLYLSAEIVRLHEGKIWVESEFGVGSTFHFAIPVL